MADMASSPSFGPSPLLAFPGAVAVPPAGDTPTEGGGSTGPGVAWHYGDPMVEQRAAERGAVLLDGWTAGTVTVTGPDRLSWLHNLTTQHVADLEDGTVTQALVLSPQGHVEHEMVFVELDGTVRLLTEPGAAGPLADYLTRMTFWSKVETTDVSGEVARLTVRGAEAGAVTSRALGVDVPEPGRAAAVETPSGRGVLSRGPSGSGTEGDVVLSLARAAVGAVASALRQAGGVPAGTWAADALGIAARRPRFGIDNDARTIPNEMPWLHTAVHLQKGCYRGQETVARVHNLGRPPRRLVLLNLDGSADRLPETGDPVTLANGRAVGRVGSVAYHHEDGPIALALVKRTVDASTALLAGPVDAAVDPADVADDAAGTPLSAIDHRAFRSVARG